MMVEEISIFQNKINTEYPNRVLEQVRQKAGVHDSGSRDQNFGVSSNVESNSMVPGDQPLWRNDHGPTASSTNFQDGTFENRDYVKKLEHSVGWLEEKL